jgi:hypothetical protein
MKYLYLFLEALLYAVSSALFIAVFTKYRYRPAFEKKVEGIDKSTANVIWTFLGIFFGIVLMIFLVWRFVGEGQPHRIGYFTSFFISGLVTLAYFRQSIPHVDLRLCVPSMVIVWLLLLIFEALIIYFKAGWVYTGSTVLAFKVGWFTVILENFVFFYIFAPFMSILIFTGLAFNRSDRQAFLMMSIIIWVGGIVWEYGSIGMFKLWYMIEDRSILAFNLFNARTTIEEMLYYVPFASLSVLMYLALYYHKYHYRLKGKAQTHERG